jgi:hypothetical protein
MNAKEFIAQLRFAIVDFSEAAPDVAIVFRTLADCIPHARTKEGMQLEDATDFRAWLRELAEESEKIPASVQSAAIK